MNHAFSRKIKAVLFDVDGVLLDSLAPHLRFCVDQAAARGLSIVVPSASAIKSMVRLGVKISPMIDFLRAAGFPDHHAEAAVLEYDSSFSWKYPVNMFPGIDDLLRWIRRRHLDLGFVTSNILENVRPGLDGVWDMFQARVSKDTFPGDKAAGIAEAAKRLRREMGEVLYVGDQPADHVAADSAGCAFVGVDWGWGISADDGEKFFVATSPRHLNDLIAFAELGE